MLRVATWNVCRGHQPYEISGLLAQHAVDVALLQECDIGMARSGNVHVPRKVAELWPGADFAMAIEFEEEGIGNERERRAAAADAVNDRGLHCNAIVGRDLPHLTHEVVLSAGREWMASDQPRRGGRKALIARVEKIHLASVHLENRTSPAKRAGQMKRLLRALEQIDAWAVVIGGDLNCKEGEGEPLFELAAGYGYEWKEANADVGRWSGRRLDWFLYRGVAVSNPRTIDAEGISDHDLMLLDVHS